MVATVEIDEGLLQEAMDVLGPKPARELVENELREAIAYRRAQLRMLDLRGKVEWVGDLDAMRRDRWS